MSNVTQVETVSTAADKAKIGVSAVLLVGSVVAFYLLSAQDTWVRAAALIALLLVLRVYSALLSVIDSLPLLPGLLELAGVVAVTRFSLRRLVRSDARRQLFEDLRQRWQAFRGQP